MPVAGRLLAHPALASSSSAAAARLRLLPSRQLATPAASGCSSTGRHFGGRPRCWHAHNNGCVNITVKGWAPSPPPSRHARQVGGYSATSRFITTHHHLITTRGVRGYARSARDTSTDDTSTSCAEGDPQVVEVRVPPGVSPEPARLDAFLTANVPGVSRGRIVSSIKDGLVDVNGGGGGVHSRARLVRVHTF